ncbi:hypothetical protein HY450_01545 [Candidatus Pacearchaeota archaeon]|nr:hypothetical protein [Candidatus Pacearchaeota archaeon]
MTWYKYQFYVELQDADEAWFIKRDLISGREVKFVNNHNGYVGDISNTYFLSNSDTNYILELDRYLSEDFNSIQIRVFASERAVVEREMLRARSIVDNITRIRRERIKRAEEEAIAR